LRIEREAEINEEMAAIKEVEYLLEKEDFDAAERALEKVVNHKMDEKLVKVKEVSYYKID
jgi:predicted negative regulator of RcsB-dependent stress response